MAEGVEKRSVGDPVAQFKIYMEAIFRDQERLDYDAVRVFYLANVVSECASLTGRLFNFIPKLNCFGNFYAIFDRSFRKRYFRHFYWF